MLSAIQIEDRALRQQLDQLPQELGDAVERGLLRATELLRVAVSTLASPMSQAPLGVPAASPLGELAASVKTEVMVNRGATIGSGGQRPDAVPVGRVFLAPPADQYGLFVELGTRPHFPPPGALDGWVRRRLGITNDRAVREVAFLIGRKIARVGTPGRLLFERALRENESRVVAVMQEELAKALV